jgi:uncharacterized membrane protein
MMGSKKAISSPTVPPQKQHITTMTITTIAQVGKRKGCLTGGVGAGLSDTLIVVV